MRHLSISRRFAVPCALAAFTATSAFAQDTTGAVQRAAAPPAASATLAGVVRDSTGAPVPDAEIVIHELLRTVRADTAGRFVLGGVTPGAYQVWFRRLGYQSVIYNWAARFDERTDVAVTLRALPRTLDPVVVRAQEDKRLRQTSQIVGIVFDSAGQAIDDAEVQLVGGNRTGLTREGGKFGFGALSAGTYVLRARKLGYAPNMLAVQLGDSENREVGIVLRPLPTTLDAVTTNARSGYGNDQAWNDLDLRQRWHASPQQIVLGPDDMAHFGSLPLSAAVQFMGVGAAEAYGAGLMSAPKNIPLPSGACAPTSPAKPLSKGKDAIAAAAAAQEQAQERANGKCPMSVQEQRAAQQSSGMTAGSMVTDDVCMLINGKDAREGPLSMFSANQIALIEVYPTGSELTGTVASKMTGHCRPNDSNSSDPALLDHPTYYVIWLKDAM